MSRINKHNQKYIAYGVIFIFVIGMITTYMGGCKKKSDNLIETFKKDLPPGTSLAEVDSYLKKTKCEYSYGEQSKCFTAVLRDVDKGIIVTGSLTMTIKMDEHDKLKDLDIKMAYTGP